MTKNTYIEVQRGTAHAEGIINFDFETVWQLLINWGNQEWWPSEMKDDAGMEVGRTYLEGDKDKVPRTKVIVRANAENRDLPIENRETLFIEDKIGRRLYYDASDNFSPGVRNYIASWSFDPLPDGRTKMIIHSNFDVIEPGNLHEFQEIIDEVYVLILRGINDFLAARNK